MPSYRLFKSPVDILDIHGELLVLTSAPDLYRALRSESMCSLAELPAPPNELYNTLRLLAFKRPAILSDSIRACTQEHILAHMVVSGLGESPHSRLGVLPYPSEIQSRHYTVRYFTKGFYDDVKMDWAECDKCNLLYEHHVDEKCPLYLGEEFVSRLNDSVSAIRKAVEFANALPKWLASQSDVIYRIATERLYAAETAIGTSAYTRGEFTPYFDNSTGRSLATTGDGPGNTISGVPGDNSHR